LTSASWEILDSPDLIKFKPSKSLMRAFKAQRVGDSIGRAPLYKSRDGVESWRLMVVTEVDRPTPNGGDVTWKEFFEGREALYEQCQESETLSDRQRRIDRETLAQSGWSATARYFKWEVDVALGVRVRTPWPIPREAMRLEMMHYWPAQWRFNSFANEWDVCSKFGGGAADMGGLGFYEDGKSDVGDERPEDPPSLLDLDPGPYSLPEVVVEDSPLSPPPTPYCELNPEHVQHLPWTMALQVPLLWGLYLEDVPAGLAPLSAGHLNLLYQALGEETQPRPLQDIPINCLLYYFFMSI
jgi:hypothetical protein